MLRITRDEVYPEAIKPIIKMNLASCYYRLGMQDSALVYHPYFEPVFVDAYDVIQTEAFNAKISAKIDADDYGGSIPLLKDLYKQESSITKQKCPYTCNTLITLLYCYIAVGDAENALKLLPEIAEVFRISPSYARAKAMDLQFALNSLYGYLSSTDQWLECMDARVDIYSVFANDPLHSGYDGVYSQVVLDRSQVLLDAEISRRGGMEAVASDPSFMTILEEIQKIQKESICQYSPTVKTYNESRVIFDIYICQNFVESKTKQKKQLHTIFDKLVKSSDLSNRGQLNFIKGRLSQNAEFFAQIEESKYFVQLYNNVVSSPIFNFDEDVEFVLSTLNYLDIDNQLKTAREIYANADLSDDERLEIIKKLISALSKQNSYEEALALYQSIDLSKVSFPQRESIERDILDIYEKLNDTKNFHQLQDRLFDETIAYLKGMKPTDFSMKQEYQLYVYVLSRSYLTIKTKEDVQKCESLILFLQDSERKHSIDLEDKINGLYDRIAKYYLDNNQLMEAAQIYKRLLDGIKDESFEGLFHKYSYTCQIANIYSTIEPELTIQLYQDALGLFNDSIRSFEDMQMFDPEMKGVVYGAMFSSVSVTLAEYLWKISEISWTYSDNEIVSSLYKDYYSILNSVITTAAKPWQEHDPESYNEYKNQYLSYKKNGQTNSWTEELMASDDRSDEEIFNENMSLVESALSEYNQQKTKSNAIKVLNSYSNAGHSLPDEKRLPFYTQMVEFYESNRSLIASEVLGYDIDLPLYEFGLLMAYVDVIKDKIANHSYEQASALFRNAFDLSIKQYASDASNGKTPYNLGLGALACEMLDDNRFQLDIDAVYDFMIFSKSSSYTIKKHILDSIESSCDDYFIQKLQQIRYLEDCIKQSKPVVLFGHNVNTEIAKLMIIDKNESLLRFAAPVFNTNALMEIDWKKMQQALDESDVSVDVFAYDDHDGNKQYSAFTISKDRGLGYVKICSETELNAIYSADKIAPFIWDKLRDATEGKNRVFFSPDGELHKLPVEYSIDKMVYRVTSMTEILKNDNDSSVADAALFGGLYYDGNTISDSSEYQDRDGLKYLPASEAEVNEIARMLQKQSISVKSYMGENGTENNFRNPEYTNKNILHIATHGFYNAKESSSEEPLNVFSYEDKLLNKVGLVLSSSYSSDLDNDGKISAADISRLDFSKTKLVVLSACVSALGDYMDESVYNLPRAFKQAGASTILASLWKVNDMATKLFMTSFYEHLLKGDDYVQCLKMAQRSVREYEVEVDYAGQSLLDIANSTGGGKYHPFDNPKYWAAFVLIDAM